MSVAIEVRELHFRYGDGPPALAGVSFVVRAGERVGIVGPNGAGKSTLLLHLNGILPEGGPVASAVTVDGVPLTRQTLPTIRRRIGLLFQDPNDQLFCPTVFEDVAFGPEQQGLTGEALRARVREALAAVGLEGFEERSPHRLSAGEKRRACLAGVLACQPSVLVLDEPTANLDPRGRRELVALVSRIPITTLIATHDLELVVKLCSRVLLLDGGRLVAQGRAVELLADEALMLAHGLETPHQLRHLHPH